MGTDEAPAPGAGGRARSAERNGAVLLGALLATATLQYAWNGWLVTPLTGYDSGGHAGYIFTLLSDRRWPLPLEGWSTFHPPLYHLLGAAVWAALEPLGPRAVVAGLRGLSALALLGAGAVAFRLVRRAGGGVAVAGVATAGVLFLPASQLAASTIGNEALGAGLAALALPWILDLQADPRRRAAAALAGLFVGLALATKYTGVLVAAAALVPFLGRGFDRRRAAALALLLAVLAGLAAPIYLRNLRLTGSLVPMTRHLQPMKATEDLLTLRPRRLLDYASFPVECIRRPSVFHVDGPPAPGTRWNRAMLSVPGLTYASLWYDAFAVRIPVRFHVDATPWGRWLLLAGATPTALVLLGLGTALAELVRRRGHSPDAPLVVMALLGLAAFAVTTWRLPSLAVVKGSYLLPLVVPAAVFFARGVRALGAAPARAALAVSAVAFALAAVVFTSHVVFPPQEVALPRQWIAVGRYLAGSHIDAAALWLLPPR